MSARTVGCGLLVLALIMSLGGPARAFQPAAQNEAFEIPLPAYDFLGQNSYQRDVGSLQIERTLSVRYGGDWRVHSFNPRTRTPHFVYGRGPRIGEGPIDSAADLKARARRVVSENADLLKSGLENLRLTATPRAMGKWAAHFQQTYRGVDVHEGTLRLVFSEDGRLMLMGSDCHDDIDLDARPALDAAAAEDIARQALPFDPATDRIEDATTLLVLPYPLSASEVEHHLVWRVRLRTEDPLGIWVSHVDAHSGEILWRFNDIHFAYGGDAEEVAHDYGYCDGDPATQAMPYLRIDVDGVGTVVSDENGDWSIAGSGGDRAVSCDIEGPWCHVFDNVSGPEGFFTATVQENLPLTVRFEPGNSQQDERDVFDSISDTHDFFQLFDPGFGYANQQIGARVSIDAGCNAYWDGNINFYRQRDGCANTGELQQVVHHEFGHGVQASILGGQGNEGLGEGNSDILGNLITQDSVIGRGFSLGNCGGGIRDSDNTLVYPDHVVGQEIHFAGQVIAGFNWDAMIMLQDLYGAEQGTILSAERWHFGRVLLHPNYQPDQVLATFIADDDDGDLSNGTPHHAIFCEAAQNHNFECPEILFGVIFAHTPLSDTMDTENPRTVETVIYSTEAPIDEATARLYWRASEGPWNEAPMSADGEDSYSGQIPPQQGGRIDYYFYAEDTMGHTGFEPQNAPGSYHSYLVAWFIDDLEGEDQGWTVGFPGDDATDGFWVRANPRGTIAQPEDDHTEDGTLCWITGQNNAGAPGIGDVDGGATTLLSPVWDLGGATELNIRYWKWYSNNMGSNPGEDYWDVYITNDAGGDWTVVEHTNVSTNAWASLLLDFDDYFPFEDPGLVQLRFVASDYGDGSLVEAAVDDITIQAFFGTSAPDDGLALGFVTELDQNHPNPFNPKTEIRFNLKEAGPASLRVFDAAGRKLRDLVSGDQAAGQHRVIWDGKDAEGRPVSSGMYFYRLETDGQTLSRRMLLVK